MPLWLLATVVVLVLIVVIGGGIWLFQTVEAMASAWEVSQPEFGEVSEAQPVDPNQNNPIVSAENAPQQPVTNDSELPTVALQAWQGTDRLNFLLLGVGELVSFSCHCNIQYFTFFQTVIFIFKFQLVFY